MTSAELLRVAMRKPALVLAARAWLLRSALDRPEPGATVVFLIDALGCTREEAQWVETELRHELAAWEHEAKICGLELKWRDR